VIRWRLTLWNMAICFLVLLLLGELVYQRTRDNLYASVDRELLQRIELVPQGWQSGRWRRPPRMQPPSTPVEDREGPNREQFARLERRRQLLFPRVVQPDGKAFVAGREPLWAPEMLAKVEPTKSVLSTAIVEIGGQKQHLRLATAGVYEDSKLVAVAQFAVDLDDTEAELRRLRETLLAALPLGIILTGLAGLIMTARALRPVGELAEAANQITADRLGDRLPVKSDDEFSRVARAFNSVLDRVESAVSDLTQANIAQKKFVADASHELRSPLTAMKVRLGAAKMREPSAAGTEELVKSLDRSVSAMARLVDDLLILARSADLGPPKKQSVTAAELADEAMHPIPEPLRSRIVLIAPDDLALNVDLNQMSRAIRNLLENALHYSEGEVLLTFGVGEITVSDCGIGIPPESVGKVFDRFYRVDESRTRDSGGSGLGLSICRAIVEAHGGTVDLESEVGKGTTVRVSLPA